MNYSINNGANGCKIGVQSLPNDSGFNLARMAATFFLAECGANMETHTKKHKLNGEVDVIDENKKKKNKK
jgi:hypothetical protein